MKISIIRDLTITTQLCTIFSAVSLYIAHLIDNGTILNPNWHWAVYVLLAFSTVFMVIPHLFCDQTIERIGDEVFTDLMEEAEANVRIAYDSEMHLPTDPEYMRN